MNQLQLPRPRCVKSKHTLSPSHYYVSEPISLCECLSSVGVCYVIL